MPGIARPVVRSAAPAAKPIAIARPVVQEIAVARPSPVIALNSPPPVITSSGPVPVSRSPIPVFKLPVSDVITNPTKKFGAVVQEAMKGDMPRLPKKPSMPITDGPSTDATAPPPSPADAQPSGGGGGSGDSGGSQQESQEDQREESPREETREEGRQEARSDAEDSGEESEGEAEEAEPDNYDYTDDLFNGENLEVPFVSSHVHGDIMHTAAVTFAPHGAECIVTRVRCPKADQNGLVNFAGENPEWVEDGINRTTAAIVTKAKLQAPEKEIGSLVRRARAGDQNAMGIISMVRVRASEGDATAMRSARLMHDYIRRHPATDDMGAELDASQKTDAKTEREKLRAIIVLANGAPLSRTTVQHIISAFPTDKHQKLFVYGLIRFRPTEGTKEIEKRLDAVSKSVLDTGRIFGEARAIQMVRLPGSSITKFDPMIGWELGE